MKKKKILADSILASLAVATVLAAGIGSANAYFTTYAEAKGGIPVELGDRTQIWEGFSEWTKKLVITAEEDSEPVWVRARAFARSDYPLVYTYAGNDIPYYTTAESVPGDVVWYTLGDGYYYYNGLVDLEHPSAQLDIKITGVPVKPEDSTEGSTEDFAPEDFNVIVIYESTPVRYDEGGNLLPADWNEILDSNLNTEGEQQPADPGQGGEEQPAEPEQGGSEQQEPTEPEQDANPADGDVQQGEGGEG